MDAYESNKLTEPLQTSSTLSLLQQAAKDVDIEGNQLSTMEFMPRQATSPPRSPKKLTVTFDDTISLQKESSNPILDAIGDIQSMMKDIEMSKSESPAEQYEADSKLGADDELDAKAIENKDVNLSDEDFKTNQTKEFRLVQNDSWKERYLHKRSKLLDHQQDDLRSSVTRTSADTMVKALPSQEARTLRSSYESGLARRPSIQSLLTKEKELLFLRMKQLVVDQDRAKNSKAKGVNDRAGPKTAKSISASMDRLTKSRTRSSTASSEVYALDDEKTNCTFQPKLKKYHNTESKSESEHKQQFYDRQDALERSRREKMKDSIGMKDYDSLLTKKYCPSCGAKQSYDEVKEKRKKCSICQVEFKSKLAWNTVAKKFLTAEEKFLARIEEKRKRLAEEIDQERHMMVVKKFDKDSKKIVEFLEICPDYRGDHKWTKAVEDEFFQRLSEYHHLKEEKLKKIAEDVSTRLYPFQPTVGKAKVTQLEEEEDIDEGPSFQAFLERYYKDLAARHRDVPRIPYLGTSKSTTNRDYGRVGDGYAASLGRSRSWSAGRVTGHSRSTMF
jgi:hypothetical protein